MSDSPAEQLRQALASATVEYLASMFGIQPQGSPRNQTVTHVMLQSLDT